VLSFHRFLDRLESGVLLYETQQGMVGVELTLWQRVYLLWTFRHFRQLSVLLLNSRQLALVSALFRENAGTAAHLDELGPVVGVIENFVPPPHIDLSAAQERERREAEVAQSAEIPPPPGLEIARPAPVRGSSPPLVWFRRAATIAGLLLCISAAVWHRGQALPKALAHNQTHLQQINETGGGVPQYSPKPAIVSESAAAIDSVAVPVPPRATVKTAVKSASLSTLVPSRKRAARAHDSALTAKTSFPGSADDRDIQATRAPLRCVYPVYPNARVRGKVTLTARLDSDGVVRGVRVVSGNRALAAAAVRAIRQWRYGPYLKDGQRVATESNISISFIAEDAILMSFPPSIAGTR